MSSSLRAHTCPAAGRLLQAHVLVRPDTDRATVALPRASRRARFAHSGSLTSARRARLVHHVAQRGRCLPPCGRTPVPPPGGSFRRTSRHRLGHCGFWRARGRLRRSRPLASALGAQGGRKYTVLRAARSKTVHFRPVLAVTTSCRPWPGWRDASPSPVGGRRCGASGGGRPCNRSLGRSPGLAPRRAGVGRGGAIRRPQG